jgi:hypothetical protein
MINVPYLRKKGFFRVDDSGYLFFEGTDDHGIGHYQGKGMVKLHLLVDVFEIILVQENATSRVMFSERGGV